MARHSVFSARLGTVHRSNATPAAALTAYIVVMFAVPAIWATQTDVLNVFNFAGTLAEVHAGDVVMPIQITCSHC
jgi:amino acid transporter